MNLIKSTWQNANLRHWVGILGLMALSVFGMNGYHHMGTGLTALLNLLKPAAFDGTVLPIQRVPDWTHLTQAEYTANYKDLPLDKFLNEVPLYNNSDFTFPSSSLVWGNASHNKIRNTKITYPVAYTGDYTLEDTGEGSGSHPAVDIKVLKDTPIHNVANGVVAQSGYSASWGNYVVVKYANVPAPNQAQLTDMYCTYAHMSGAPFVQEGEVLVKNQVIGEVGDTGTATTHHLHFQCDTTEAPWHPYWPFTTAEASKAGYGFFEAVNAGLGLDNLYAYTYNPMQWVQENLDTTVVSVPVSTPQAPAESVPESTPANPVVVETVENFDPIEPVENPAENTLAFYEADLKGPEYIITGDQKEITLQLLDANGNLMNESAFYGEMQVSLSNEAIGNLNDTRLEASDFKNGETALVLYADHAGTVDVMVRVNGQSFTAGTVRFIDQIQPFAKFGVEHDGAFVLKQPEDIRILALDFEGEATPSFRGDGPVELSLLSGKGYFSKATLKRSDFNTGIAHVDFTATSPEDVVIQVTYGTSQVSSKKLQLRLFDDLSENDTSYDAITFLYKKGAITGYPNGTFQPDRAVNRVEALKLAFSGLEVEAMANEASFPDTERNQWYSNYLGSAVQLGVVSGYPDGHFRPLQTVNKVELLKILLTLADIPVNSTVTENPYADVDRSAWYASYVQFAKENNLFPVEGSRFNPSEPMSRREVAEVIYRLIQAL